MWHSLRFLEFSLQLHIHGNLRFDLTASESYNSIVEGPQTHTKMIIHQDAVKRSVEDLRTIKSISLGIVNFLVNSKILNWTNKASFRKELPLGSLNSKKLATSERSFTDLVAFQLQNCVDAKLRHIVTVTNCAFLGFIQVHLVKAEQVTRKLE
jgi:hypothetical protein